MLSQATLFPPRPRPSAANEQVLNAVRIGGAKVVDIVKQTIEKEEKQERIQLDSLDEDGFAVLHHVVLLGHLAPSLIDFLISHGAFVDVRDLLDETPLILASRYYSAECIERLVALGANPHLKDRHGFTALDYLEKQDETAKSSKKPKKKSQSLEDNTSSSSQEAISNEAAKARCKAAVRAAMTAPNSNDILFTIGHEHTKRGRCEEALTTFARLNSSNSSSSEQQWRIKADCAICNIKLERFAAAISEAVICTRLDDKIAEGWLLLSYGHIGCKDYPRARVAAEEGLRKCVENDPNFNNLLEIVSKLVERNVPPRPCIDLDRARAALAKLTSNSNGSNNNAIYTANCNYCLRKCPLPLDSICPFCACDPTGIGVPHDFIPINLK